MSEVLTDAAPCDLNIQPVSSEEMEISAYLWMRGQSAELPLPGSFSALEVKK
jgi:hypothetical protein